MAEFTGERVVPGEVDTDLMNEHLARYAFAARLSRGRRVLDAGCGAGYGSAELAKTALWVTGCDASPAAVAYAREHYRLSNLQFVQATCAALPHPDASFDLVVAFEVIEHLGDWREFLLEVRRVLVPSGQFIVSTPNKLYYAESRRIAGPNPFHEREFEFAEFREALTTVFPHISLFLENHVEGVVFQPLEPAETAEVRVDAGEVSPARSHFFVAVCAHRPQTGNPSFIYIPSAANVLRERERHIELLESELRAKNEWLEKAKDELAQLNQEHQELLEKFRGLQGELENSNRWAEGLNQELAAAGTRMTELQDELAREEAAARQVAAGYEAKVAELEEVNRLKTQWALDTEERLGRELREKAEELAKCVEYLHQAEKTIEERTAWAGRLQTEAYHLGKALGACKASRWVKLGRTFGLGPELPE